MARIVSTGCIENNIQKMRATKGLTQQELADTVGVTRATILALERGDYNPSLELAFRLSNFFKIPVEQLFKFRPNSKGVK